MTEPELRWADCGEDGAGRRIGYAFEAVCDHPECGEKIDRGLGHACGNVHGGEGLGCDGYFCEAHAANSVKRGGSEVEVCDACRDALLGSGEWIDDGWEHALIPADSFFGGRLTPRRAVCATASGSTRPSPTPATG